MLDAFGQKEKKYSDICVTQCTEYSYIHFLDVQLLEMGLQQR